MAAIRIYEEDLKIASDILKRDASVTRNYFYKQCYHLFKSIYDNYYTDCESCLEFMNEIYVLIMTPSRDGHCQLENYRGESTLKTWLKVACLFYCYGRYERKQRWSRVDFPENSDEEKDDATDRLLDTFGSTTLDMTNIEREDMEAIIGLMPNARYKELIRLRYLEEKTNEETAAVLGMSMENYYNKHKLAKVQFVQMARKEDVQV